MENNHPLSELMRTTLDSVRAMADANTIVGAPIQADGVTLIPVSKLSFGVAGGGTEFTTKKQPAGDNAFGGGSGASAKLEPVAFLVIRDGSVKLLPVSPADAGKTVAQLLGEVEVKTSRTLVLEPGAYPPALVLANFREKDLDTLLDLMKQAQVNIPLKAVITPSNKNWVFGDLLAHLSEEHAAFTAAAKEQA